MSEHADVVREAIWLCGYPEGGYQIEQDAGYAALKELLAERDALQERVSFLVAEAHGWQPKLEAAEAQVDELNAFAVKLQNEAEDQRRRAAFLVDEMLFVNDVAMSWHGNEEAKARALGVIGTRSGGP